MIFVDTDVDKEFVLNGAFGMEGIPNVEQLLMEAISKNDLKSLNYYLSKGAKPNKISSNGLTPLGLAVKEGNLIMVKTLAEHQKGVVSQLKASYNSSFTEGNVTNLEFTINKGRHRNIGFFVVCKDGEDNNFGDGPTPDGMEGLEWDSEIEMDNNTEGEDRLSSTPPDAEIYKWYADILNKTAVVLESPENDIARFDKLGCNLLHHAINEGHCAVAEYLLDNFKEIGVNQADVHCASPLQMAVFHSNEAMVQLLIRKGALVNYSDQHGRTPLHCAARIAGNLNIVNILLENGANLNAPDLEERTPLSHAILRGFENVATLLIRKGTRLNCEEIGGETVLSHAVGNNMTEVAKELLDAGAKIRQSHHLVHIAIRHNNCDMVKLLHRRGVLLNVRDEQGHTPLMLACLYANLEIVRYLLQNGAVVNARNEINDLTPLHICMNSMEDSATLRPFLELLLVHHADINASSYSGSVLFYAILLGNISGACELIRYGANVNSGEEQIHFTDNLCIAKSAGNLRLLKLMIYAGFKFPNCYPKFTYTEAELENPLNRFLAYSRANPLSLKDLCRIRVRHLFTGNIIQKMYQLPLPSVLLRFLAFDEFMPDKE